MKSEDKESLPAASDSRQPCEDKPYSFIYDETRETWVCSKHGDTDWTAWVSCFTGCEDGFFDEYEDDPINCSPGEMSFCEECRGKGGWTVCGQCNLDNPDAEF